MSKEEEPKSGGDDPDLLRGPGAGRGKSQTPGQDSPDLLRSQQPFGNGLEPRHFGAVPGPVNPTGFDHRESPTLKGVTGQPYAIRVTDTQSETAHSPLDQKTRSAFPDEVLEELDRSIHLIFPEEESGERFSDSWSLRMHVLPYLTEYPFLAADIPTLQEVWALLHSPLCPPDRSGAYGVRDGGSNWATGERDRQIREFLNEAKAEGP